MNQQQKNDIRDLILNPSEIGTAIVNWAEFNASHPGITWGIPTLDEKIIPLRPGKVCGLVARPGNCKTTLMAALAKREALRLQATKTTKECVVYVTLEQLAEEIESFFISDGDISASDIAWNRVNLDTIRRKALERADLPLYLIGYSHLRAGSSQPKMTLNNVLNAIESMEADYHVKPTLVCIDYMQIIPVQGFSSKIEQMEQAPKLVKQLALRLGVPIVVGVQASRAVDDLKIKIPAMAHAQWGSAIEQACDVLFGMWRPAVTEEVGTIIRLRNKDYTVTPHLFLMRMLKQRGDDGRWTWALNFQPQYLKLEEREQDLYADDY